MNLPHLWSSDPLCSEKPILGVGTWSPPQATALGSLGEGPSSFSVMGRQWGQQSLGGQGLRVARAQEAAGPLVPMAHQTQACFCLIPSSDTHGTCSAQTPTSKEKRGQHGVAGGARSWLTTQAHGDPRKDLPEEMPRGTEAL